MLGALRRAFTAEGRRQKELEELMLDWLNKQLLPPAPGRPRIVTFNKGEADERSCHVTPCYTRSQGVEYVDLDVRETQESGVVMTIRATAERADYVRTIWR